MSKRKADKNERYRKPRKDREHPEDIVHIESLHIDKDDCYGSLFHTASKACQMCGNQFTCQMITQDPKKILSKIDKGLAETDIELIDWEAVYAVIKKRGTTWEKLFNAVKKNCKIKDDRTVDIVIENFLLEKDLNVDDEGNIY